MEGGRGHRVGTGELPLVLDALCCRRSREGWEEVAVGVSEGSCFDLAAAAERSRERGGRQMETTIQFCRLQLFAFTDR
jgi:hypothetical protein